MAKIFFAFRIEASERPCFKDLYLRKASFVGKLASDADSSNTAQSKAAKNPMLKLNLMTLVIRNEALQAIVGL